METWPGTYPPLHAVAMLDALEDGSIAGAGLDVFQNELEIDDAFRNNPRVLMTPPKESAKDSVPAGLGRAGARQSQCSFRRKASRLRRRLD